MFQTGVAIDEDGSIAIQPSEWFDNGWHIGGLRYLTHYQGLPKGKQHTLCYGFEGPILSCLMFSEFLRPPSTHENGFKSQN